MRFEDKVDRWFRSLPDELRLEACSVVGALPPWMVESLRDADIEPTQAETFAGGGEPAFTMPRELLSYLEHPPRAEPRRPGRP